MPKNIRPNLSYIVDEWPSPFVSRRENPTFTNKAISSNYMKNLDSLGLGPRGRIISGRRVLYPKHQLIEWLEERSIDLDKVEGKNPILVGIKKHKTK